uniref:Musashi RNA binding protein 1 n=1 Tax=Tetraodon nigroviridis TaxID=99883 RepID=H3C9I4_TETNG
REPEQPVLRHDNSPHDPCKMFIGGLSWQTTQEGLKEYFCKFGEVKECMVMRDPVTKRSSGFFWFLFRDNDNTEEFPNSPEHFFSPKQIDPKVAFPRRAQPKLVTRTKKIFVGGLSVNTTIEDVKHYFDQFGKVDDAMLMFDKTTNRHRAPPSFPFCQYMSEAEEFSTIHTHTHDLSHYLSDKKTNKPKNKINSYTSKVKTENSKYCQTMDFFFFFFATGYPGFQTTTYTSRSYTGIAPGYTYQFPGCNTTNYRCNSSSVPGDPAALSPSAIPLTAYGPMAAAAAAAVVRGKRACVSVVTLASSPRPSGSTPSRTAGFLGTSSPGPMADLYAAANQDSGVSGYISAASPAPSTGFGHGLGGPLIATAFTNGYH